MMYKAPLLVLILKIIKVSMLAITPPNSNFRKQIFIYGQDVFVILVPAIITQSNLKKI